MLGSVRHETLTGAGTVTALGYAWVPYAVAGALLVALALTRSVRARSAVNESTRSWLAVRGAALILIAVPLALLADAATEGDGLTAVDRPIWSWLVDHRSPTATALFRVVTQVGSTLSMGVLASVVVIVLALRARRPDAIFVAVVAIGAGVLVSVAKPLVGRARPPLADRLVVETNQSFPSGHAVASAAIIGALAVLFVPFIGRRWLRYVAVVTAAAFVGVIGLSRLYLGVHWSTDVLGGWLSGGGWLLLCLTVRQLNSSRIQRRPVGDIPG